MNGTRNAGSNSIVRKAYIMGNGQPTKTESALEKKADTSADSHESRLVAVTQKPESESLSTPTTVVSPNALPKTSQTQDLAELRSALSLVAGALADFQSAGGTIKRLNMEYTLPSGSRHKAMKIILAVKGIDLVAVNTPDGIIFDLVAVT